MEIEIIKFIQQFRTPFLDVLFQVITFIGEDAFITVVLTLIFLCINKRFAYMMGIAYMTNGIINTSLKEIFRVPRPIGQPGVQSLRTQTAGGYSFPSGHSQSAASVLTSLAIKIKKKWFYILGSVLVFLVALSRMYLGVHTLKDVVCGVVLGVVWVLVSNKIFCYAERTNKRYILLLYLIPVAAGMLFFHTETFYKAAGVLVSLLIGYIIESRYIRYDVKAPIWKQIIKYIIGLGVLLLIKEYVKVLLPPVLISQFIRYFIMGAWIFVLSPMLFILLKLGARDTETQQ